MQVRSSGRPSSLCGHLDHEPRALKFGTSGRRGEVIHLTQLEIYINALAELEYLQSLPPPEGGIRRGDAFCFAYDLRPSSTSFVAEQGGRGEIVQALEAAIRDAGLRPVNLGPIPTPALAGYALSRGQGGMMVTGSHIPFDWNGYKTYTSRGELMKEDEQPINVRVEDVRRRLCDQPFADSPFDARGMFKAGHRELSPVTDAGREHYRRRYAGFFAGQDLAGLRLLVYQHSAVGRDLLVDVLRDFGATVIPAGRSDTFVPIDTENIDAERLAAIQALADEAGDIDAVVSTDGDSDRPLLLSVERGRVKFHGGDLVGILVAEYLGADAVVVPITGNDALDRGSLKDKVEPRTRIGSPHVIAGMEAARGKGRRAVCGWEANGGFFLGSDLERAGRVLSALPTRDALLPILCVLFRMRQDRLSMASLFHRLPPRFGCSALLRNVPRERGQRIVQRFSPPETAIRQVLYGDHGVEFLDAERRVWPRTDALEHWARQARGALARYFTPTLGFADITRLDYTDGLRVYFANGDIVHIRPSGNADELRIHGLADTQARADEIAGIGVAEPEGLLRRLARAI